MKEARDQAMGKGKGSALDRALDGKALSQALDRINTREAEAYLRSHDPIEGTEKLLPRGYLRRIQAEADQYRELRAAFEACPGALLDHDNCLVLARRAGLLWAAEEIKPREDIGCGSCHMCKEDPALDKALALAEGEQGVEKAMEYVRREDREDRECRRVHGGHEFALDGPPIEQPRVRCTKCGAVRWAVNYWLHHNRPPMPGKEVEDV